MVSPKPVATEMAESIGEEVSVKVDTIVTVDLTGGAGKELVSDTGQEQSVGMPDPHIPIHIDPVKERSTVEEVPPDATEGQKSLEETDEQLEETNRKLLALLERQPKDDH
ncbi:hypothetical protein M569_12589 [Genlisea aurea]|uniref:Uncharacterized protein n=1 Tax=Genlisea aurea TaxID=192259 RepID=S8C623_9LAMI|nr:hypothetical protein M569_12589 [Genlisea aurea]